MDRHLLSITVAAALVAGIAPWTEAQGAVGGGGGRGAGMAASSAAARTSINQNIQVNHNVNVNRQVNIDIDTRPEHRPVARAAVAAAVVGTVAYTLPPACSEVLVSGVAYQNCGGTWYQPQFAGTQVTYVVVNAPQ